MIARRLFGLVAMLAVLMGASLSAEAQEVKYYVVQSTGVFEITNGSTGGRFIIAPRNEYISVPGRGTMQVRGRTDRAARGETVVTQVRGSGSAHVTVTYQPQGGRPTPIFSGPCNLPLVVPRLVSPATDFDNVNVSVHRNGRTISRRLPIGRR
jgi:hypothetical protein